MLAFGMVRKVPSVLMDRFWLVDAEWDGLNLVLNFVLNVVAVWWKDLGLGLALEGWI